MSVNKTQLKDELLCREVVAYYLSEEKPVIATAAKKFDLSLHTAQAMIQLVLSVEKRHEERILRLSRSKTGNLNPMKGKLRDFRPNYRGKVSDGKGYMLVLKPAWFTGRKGSKHVFEHHLVLCEALGWTEIPEDFVVHHIDEVPTNNRIDNLALVTPSAHRTLHSSSPWRKLSPWEKHVYGILK